MPRECKSSSTHWSRSTTCRTCTRRPPSRRVRCDNAHADARAASVRALFSRLSCQPGRAMPSAVVSVRRILGIDPGLRITGFGLIVCVGGKLTYVTSGCIRNTDGSLPDRLAMILRDLSSVISAHHPTEVAVEKVFVNVNPNSTLLLGQARGAAISAAVLADLPVTE